MSDAARITLGAIEALAIADRPGWCDECGHESTPSLSNGVLRRLLHFAARPAACSSVTDELDWAAAGGVGPVTHCGCTGAFHGS